MLRCILVPRRQDIPQHNLEAMSDHLQLAVQAIAQQSTAIVQQSKEIAQLKRDQQEVNKTILSMGNLTSSMGKLTSITLKMENVSKFQTAKAVKGRTWYSNNFFTNFSMGYTACLRVDINGTGADSKFVSCYICVTKGEHGAHLEWPFKGTFTVSILNHSKSGKDYSRQLSSENGAQPSKINEVIFGENDFVAFSTLLADKQSIFLKDNCLFFKVTVESICSRTSP